MRGYLMRNSTPPFGRKVASVIADEGLDQQLNYCPDSSPCLPSCLPACLLTCLPVYYQPACLHYWRSITQGGEWSEVRCLGGDSAVRTERGGRGGTGGAGRRRGSFNSSRASQWISYINSLTGTDVALLWNQLPLGVLESLRYWVCTENYGAILLC
ncbi:unnamed protein product [Pleuronectes platessa]|uniref:Uncharacterized protein n=1 Tax=Pleuronectes platessa TaxID=8262 RepID=A0A9N7TSC9_PLEPL|nr:unnamed protein product [Pleuronectes platessa]